MNLKGKYEVTHCLTIRDLTQAVRDLEHLSASVYVFSSGILWSTSQQKAIVLPVMAPIMPRPVSAKGNVIAVFYAQ
jgi:hypothetical protein